MDQSHKRLPSKPPNEEQLAYVLKRLAQNWEYEEIKENFQRFFETGIDGETIITLEAKYQDKILQIRPQVLDPRRHRLAHAANRLEEYEGALQDAKTLRPVGPPVKVGPETWEPGPLGMNVQGIVAIGKLCMQEELMHKNFYLKLVQTKIEQAKEELIGSGFSSGEVMVNTGIDDEE